MKKKTSLYSMKKDRKKFIQLFAIIGLFLIGGFAVGAVCTGDASKEVSTVQHAEVVVVGVATLIAAFKELFVDGKFKELKGAELEAFIKKADAEQLAAYYNEVGDMKRKEITAKIEAKADKADIDALKTELNQTILDQMKSLNDILKQHGLMIKKLSQSEKDEHAASMETIRKGLQDNIEKLKGLKSGNAKESAQNNVFTFKAAGTMLESNNISGGNVPVEQRIVGLNVVASRRIRLMDIVTRGSATSNLISWVYQANKDGAAGGTAEGATKNQIDFDLVVASQAVVKRTAYIKVSDEMIDDIDFIESEIRNELMRELLKDIELTAYSGNGTAPNLNGIRTVSTAFAAGTFAGTVDNANSVDVLVVAMNQIAIAEQDPATYILMHPSDVTALKLAKVSSTDKRYIDRLLLIGGQLTVDGTPIIATTLVTAGTYLVGAFNLATLYEKGVLQIEVGFDGNDFTKNLRTIRAEWRGAMIVKNNDRTAFIKGTFATDMAALETP